MRTLCTPASFVPLISRISVFHIISILSWLRTRFCMICEARNSPRRWISVTLDANLVRNKASSIAVSPPPTTTIGRSRKKNPSQVAHAETPLPPRPTGTGSSPGIPSHLADAPVETISVSASMIESTSSLSLLSLAYSLNGRSDRSTRSIQTFSILVTNRNACSRNSSIRIGPIMPFENPG